MSLLFSFRNQEQDQELVNVHNEARQNVKDDIGDLKKLREMEGEQLKLAKEILQICKELKNADADSEPISNLLKKAKEMKKICQTQKNQFSESIKEKRQDLRDHAEAIKLIQEGDEKEKAKETANTTKLLQDMRATKANDESPLGNEVTKASYYITDYHPLAYSALTFHATITSSLAEMMVSEYCDAKYQVAEWIVFLFATIGLVRLAWKANAYRKDNDNKQDTFGIFNAILSQWCVFLVLLLSTTSFIPLQCYTDSSAWPKWVASALLLGLPFLGVKLSNKLQASDSTDNGTPSSRDLDPKSDDEENALLVAGSN